MIRQWATISEAPFQEMPEIIDAALSHGAGHKHDFALGVLAQVALDTSCAGTLRVGESVCLIDYKQVRLVCVQHTRLRRGPEELVGLDAHRANLPVLTQLAEFVNSFAAFHHARGDRQHRALARYGCRE